VPTLSHAKRPRDDKDDGGKESQPGHQGREGHTGKTLKGGGTPTRGREEKSVSVSGERGLAFLSPLTSLAHTALRGIRSRTPSSGDANALAAFRSVRAVSYSSQRIEWVKRWAWSNMSMNGVGSSCRDSDRRPPR